MRNGRSINIKCFHSNGATAVNSQRNFTTTTATQPSPAPTRTGYTFAGWYSDAGLTSVFNFTTPITAPSRYTAKWIINTYTITFDRNGGTVDANPTSKTATYEAMSVTITNGARARTGMPLQAGTRQVTAVNGIYCQHPVTQP